MPLNQFTDGITTVNLGQPPTRESSQSAQAFQVTGLDSAGTTYIYDKGRIIRSEFRLIFPSLNAALKDQLLAFQTDSSRGDKNTFTWYDHDGVSHTVRMVEAVQYREISAGSYRVEIALEEDVVWTPSTTTALTGTYAAPLWILKMTVNAVVYYLADSTLYIPAWDITTKPWIGSWGSIQAGVTNGLGEYQVADLSVTILIDPAASPNIEDLAITFPLEKSPAELYLYDCSGTAAPELKFAGYVRDVDLPDDTAVELVIEDETVRLANSYVGTRVDTVTYPVADPDDVGRVIPIVYGALTKLRAVCVEGGFASAITADIDSAATVFYLSDNVPTAYSLIGRVIIIDGEQMYVSAASSTSITVTRGYNGTPATAHDKGSVVIEDRSAAPLVYLVADHPVNSISKVYTRVNTIDVDITPDCTVYLGSAGSEHASYPGMACIEISNYPAIQKKTGLAIFEVAHNHNSATSTTEATTLALPTALSYYGSYPQPSGYPYSPGLCYYKAITFPASGGSRSSCAYSITINPTTTRTARILIVIVGVCKWWSDVNLVSGSPMTITFTANAGSEANANSFDVVQIGSGAGSYFNVTASSRQVYLSSVPSTYAATGASLSGNSVADVLVGDMIMVDVSRPLSIAATFNDLLARGGSADSISLGGDQSAWELTPAVPPTGEVVGSELVTNGDFASGANWTLATNAELVTNGGFNSGANWTLTLGTIGSGVLSANTASNGTIASQSLPALTIGATYRLTYTVTARTAGSVAVTIDNITHSPIIEYLPEIWAAKKVTFDFTVSAQAGTPLLKFITGPVLASGFIGSVDNISLILLTSADNVCNDGTCDLASSWGLNSGASLSGGKLVSNISVGQSIATVDCSTFFTGQTYTITYTISDYTGGILLTNIYTNSLQQDSRSANGTFSFTATVDTSKPIDLAFGAGAGGFHGSIDNITIVSQSTPAPTTVSIAAGVLNASSPGSSTFASQSLANITVGDTYRLAYTIASRSAGSANVKLAASMSVTPAYNSAAGTYTYDFTATSPGTATIIVTSASGGFTGTIDNVSLKHVTQATPGTPAVTYMLNGALTEYRPALEWLNIMAFQLRAWFRFAVGIPTLLGRPDTLTSPRALSACRIGSDGRKIHRRQKAAAADIVNKINLLYNRDWTLTGDTAYQLVTSASDATSIADFGEHERPELFVFDFVTSTTQAQALRDFYLNHYKGRPWFHEFELFLNEHDLEFGDVVSLGFSRDQVGQVLNVGFNPGNSDQIDTIRVTVAV